MLKVSHRNMRSFERHQAGGRGVGGVGLRHNPRLCRGEIEATKEEGDRSELALAVWSRVAVDFRVRVTGWASR